MSLVKWVALALLATPSRVQIDPEALEFVHEYVNLSMLGGNATTDTVAIDRFNANGSLAWVEIEVDTIHERTSLAQNYDCEQSAYAWFGNDVADPGDAVASSLLRLQIPSSTVLNDNAATYPFFACELAPYTEPGSLHQRTQFAYTNDVTTRLRHSADWSGMTGSGTWDLTGQHSAVIGYGDEVTGGATYPVTSKDWYSPIVGGPCDETLILSALNNVYATIHVTYAYTVP